MTRTIAIPDIHGMYNLLKLLIKKLKLQPDDHLIFLGDLIDRGPHSQQVVNEAMRLAETYKCTFLMGNHELMCLNYYGNSHPSHADLWFSNGGIATIKSYKNGVTPEHLKFFKSMGLYHVKDNILYTHAGLNPYYSIEKQAGNIDLWGREMWDVIQMDGNTRNIDWEMKVVVGHTPLGKPYKDKKVVGLDLGGFNTGRLAAYIAETNKIVEVKRNEI